MAFKSVTLFKPVRPGFIYPGCFFRPLLLLFISLQSRVRGGKKGEKERSGVQLFQFRFGQMEPSRPFSLLELWVGAQLLKKFGPISQFAEGEWDREGQEGNQIKKETTFVQHKK